MAYEEEPADRIRELVGGQAGLSEQKMFGGLAFLIDGNMAVAASDSGREGLMVRVDPMDGEKVRDRRIAGEGASPSLSVRASIGVDPK